MSQEQAQAFTPPTAIPQAIDNQHKQFIDLLSSDLQTKLRDLRFLNDKQKINMLKILLADCSVSVEASIIAFLLNEYGDTQHTLEIAGSCHIKKQDDLTMRCIFARLCIEQGELSIAQQLLNPFDLIAFNQNNEPYKLVDVIEFYNVCALFFFCIDQCTTALSYVTLLKQVAPKNHPYVLRMNLITYRCTCAACKEHITAVMTDAKAAPQTTGE